MDKKIISLLFSIITIVLLVSCIFLPWYSHTNHPTSALGAAAIGMRDDRYDTVDLHLTRLNYITKRDGTEWSQGISYEELNDQSRDESYFTVFTVTLYLLIITLVFAILSFTASIYKRIKSKFFVIFPLMTFILATITTVYFIVFAPESIENLAASMFSCCTYSSGPSYAWFLMIFAIVISFISFLSVHKKTAFP